MALDGVLGCGLGKGEVSPCRLAVRLDQRENGPFQKLFTEAAVE